MTMSPRDQDAARDLGESLTNDEWLGGPESDAPVGPGLHPPEHPHRAKKGASDTVEGCRERAAADLASASGMDTANGRLRFEHSAAAWAVRADLIAGLDESFDARKAAALALWAEDEAPMPRRRVIQ
jgi:hypothetical protein